MTIKEDIWLVDDAIPVDSDTETIQAWCRIRNHLWVEEKICELGERINILETKMETVYEQH